MNTPRKFITFRGEQVSLAQAAKLVGLTYATVRDRLNRGWTAEQALELPVHTDLKARGPKPLLVSHNGMDITLVELAKEMGVSKATLLSRHFRARMDGKGVFFGPPKPRKSSGPQYTFAGKTLTLGEWGKLVGIKRDTLWERMNAFGWTLEKTLTTPLKPKSTTPKQNPFHTGGYKPFSHKSHGTGVGSVALDLHGDQL